MPDLLNDTEIILFSNEIRSFIIVIFCSRERSSQRSCNFSPGASSMIMYSDWTGLSASALQAKTWGTGISNILRAWPQIRPNQYRYLKRRYYSYEFHRCDFRGCRVVARPCNRMRNPGNHIHPIIQRKLESFVKWTFGQFCDFNAFIRPNAACSNSLEFGYVKGRKPIAKLLFFVPKPAATGVMEQVCTWPLCTSGTY